MGQQYEVRGCIREDNGVTSFPLYLAGDSAEAEFFGVYENLPDGTQQCVVDIPTLDRAHSVCDWLRATPRGVRVPVVTFEEE